MYRIFAFVVFALCLLRLSGCVRRPTADPIIGGILNHFDELAQKTINQATRTGDVMTMRVANQLELAVKNLMIQFDDRYDRVLTDLNDKEQAIFNELSVLEDALKEGVQTVKRTEELVNLDMIQFTNRIGLLTKKVPFYVSSINNIMIDQQELMHTIEFVGIGFGYSTSEVQFLIQLDIEGTPIPPLQVTHKSDKVMEFTIPASFYKPCFQPRKASFLPARLTVTKNELTKKGSVKKSTPYSVDFRVTVLPKYGATLQWEEVIQTSLPKDTQSYDLPFAVGESSAEHPNFWSQPWTSPENSKIWKVEFPHNRVTGANESCFGSGCGWCYNPDGGPGPSYFTDNGRNVTVRRLCNGPACNFTHRIFYINYTDAPLIIQHDSMDVELNKLFYITLDSRNTHHEYTIRGMDYLGNLLYTDNYTSPQGPLHQLGAGSYAGTHRINFQVGNKTPPVNGK